MQIRYHCPTDGCVAIIEYEPLERCGETMTCPRCQQDRPITVTATMRDRDMVDRCAVCGGAELFVRKDFPRGVGVAVVVLFGLAAIYYFKQAPHIALAILASAAVVDLLIYMMIGRVTTCYACRAEYRKCVINPACDGFDLAASEKY